MLSVNPFCIPRNHFLQTVIDELVENDNKNLMREMISAQKNLLKVKTNINSFHHHYLTKILKILFVEHSSHCGNSMFFTLIKDLLFSFLPQRNSFL